MKKTDELTLRTMVTRLAPVRCNLSEHEAYEVRFEVLARYDSGGNIIRMDVLRTRDGGKSWELLGYRRNWRRQWWAILHKGLGGSCWPPAGDFFKAAYLKDGKFTITYWNLYEFGPKGQAYVWEMQYDASADRWDLALLEEVT